LTIYKEIDSCSNTSIISVKTFEKPLNKYLYVPQDSFHPTHSLKGFIKGEMIRYVISNSKELDFKSCVARFKSRLLDRGYLPSFINKEMSQVSYKNRLVYLFNNSKPLHKSLPLNIILDFDMFTSRAPISSLLNEIFDKHKDNSVMKDIFGGRAPMVTYRNAKSLAKLLVKASDY
jgi:hypothetical protein